MSKITNCFSNFTEVEFDTLESAAESTAGTNGRAAASNADYATVVSGLLEFKKNQLAKLMEPTQSVAAAPVEASTEQMVNQASQEMLDRMESPPVVKVVPTLKGVVPGANGSEIGAHHNGVIYLASGKLASKADVAKTLFHEMFHYGLRKLLSKEQFISQMMDLYAKDAFIKSYANQWAAGADGKLAEKFGGVEYAKARGVDEALAKLSEVSGGKFNKDGVLDKSYRAVLRWLANVAEFLGQGEWAAQIRALKNEEARAYIQDILGRAGRGETGPMKWNDEAAFSKPDPKSNLIPDDIPSAHKLGGAMAVWEWAKDAGSAAKRGFLTAEQLADHFKHIPAVRRFAVVMNKMASRTSDIMATSDKIKRDWEAADSKAGKDLALRFRRFTLDAAEAQMWANLPLTDKLNDHLDIKDPEVKAEYDQLRSRWMALHEAHKALYPAVTKDFADRRAATIEALRSGLVGSFLEESDASLKIDVLNAASKLGKAEREAFNEANAKTQAQRSTLRRMWSEVDDFNKEIGATRKGPYFPNMRFGDNVVHVKTKGYREAAAKVVKAREALAALHDTESTKVPTPEQEAAITAARKVITEAETALGELKGDPQHYHVEFFESKGEAKRAADAIRATVSDDVEVEHGLRDKFYRQLDAASPAFLSRMSERIAGAVPTASSEKLQQIMRELAYQMAPDNSAVKSRLKRKGVSGVRAEQALRAYSTSAIRDAWTISRLENQGEMDDAVNELRFHKTDMEAKEIGNELAQRAILAMQRSDSPYINAAMNVSYLSHLGLSPGFLITNLTQPWFISAPIMAGRYGTGIIGELGAAWKDAAKMVKVSRDAQGGGWNIALNIDESRKHKVITEDEANMLHQLASAGRIDITIRHDLAASSRGDEGKAGNYLNKAAQWASIPAQQIEVVNRVSTALAAYRAERRIKGGSTIDATRMADKYVADTHLNYSAENRARFMHHNSWGGWGKVMFQFRGYQQGMIALLWKNMRDATAGDKDARRALQYLFGTMLGTGGLGALPGAATVYAISSAISAMLRDDDDEPDLEQIFKRALGGGVAADVATKGALSTLLNTNLGARTGLGGIASPVAFADNTKEGKDYVASWWLAATGGAAGGMVANWAEALKEASHGNSAKAASLVLPRAFAGVQAGVKLGTDGMVDTRGNTYLQASDVSGLEVVGRALGFKSVDAASLSDRRAAYLGERQNIKEARQGMIKHYLAGKDIAEKQAAFNSRHPDNRLTVGDLMKAKQAKARYERSIKGGVPVTKQDRLLAQEYGLL